MLGQGNRQTGALSLALLGTGVRLGDLASASGWQDSREFVPGLPSSSLCLGILALPPVQFPEPFGQMQTKQTSLSSWMDGPLVPAGSSFGDGAHTHH